jgi:hypothetical protein
VRLQTVGRRICPFFVRGGVISYFQENEASLGRPAALNSMGRHRLHNTREARESDGGCWGEDEWKRGMNFDSVSLIKVGLQRAMKKRYAHGQRDLFLVNRRTFQFLDWRDLESIFFVDWSGLDVEDRSFANETTPGTRFSSFPTERLGSVTGGSGVCLL